MSYYLYLDSVLFPVTPSAVKLKIKNQNKTLTLINEGEVNILKSPGLTEVQFDLTLPHTRYPYAVYPDGFKSPEYYLNHLKRLKIEKRSFQFRFSRVTAQGKLLFDTDMTVSLEDYQIEEDARDGPDISVTVKLKQFKEFKAKTVTVEDAKPGEAAIVTVETQRPEGNAPNLKTYTVAAGDSLWNIAKKYLGDGSRYKEIQSLNPDKIVNPNLIYPGQVLTLPQRDIDRQWYLDDPKVPLAASPPYAEPKTDGDIKTENGNPVLMPSKNAGKAHVVINGKTISSAMMIGDNVWGSAKEVAAALGMLYDINMNAVYINGKWEKASWAKLSSTDGVYMLGVRDMSRKAGFEDCLSWWSDSMGMHVLINSDLKYAPAKVIREGNNFTVTAYLDFSGDYNDVFAGKTSTTFKKLVIAGLEKYWSDPNIHATSEWDFDGNPIKVNMRVYAKGDSGVSTNQRQFVSVIIDNKTVGGINAMTKGHYNNWNIKGTGNGEKVVVLSPVGISNTEDEFMRTAGHEFGHVLGIGDAYGDSQQGRSEAERTGEVPIEDFMRYANKSQLSPNLPYVTANDIEMMWQAYVEGKWQYFTDWPGYGLKSVVIRSY